MGSRFPPVGQLRVSNGGGPRVPSALRRMRLVAGLCAGLAAGSSRGAQELGGHGVRQGQAGGGQGIALPMARQVPAGFEARGDVFTVPAENGPARNLTRTPGIREINPGMYAAQTPFLRSMGN